MTCKHLNKKHFQTFPFGSKQRELDRTAEMFIDLCTQGRFDLALWLVHDGNRHDPESMKFLCERVEARHNPPS